MVLAPAIYWNDLPKTFKVKVKPAGSTVWSNGVNLYVEPGGGGTGW
jgi:hypothetical protein